MTRRRKDGAYVGSGCRIRRSKDGVYVGSGCMTRRRKDGVCVECGCRISRTRKRKMECVLVMRPGEGKIECAGMRLCSFFLAKFGFLALFFRMKNIQILRFQASFFFFGSV